MDEKVRKKRSKFDRSKDFMDVRVNDEKDLGHSVEVEPNIEKKRKHNDKKNKCGTDKVFNLNEVVEENCTGIAAKGQTCFNEGNDTFMRNGEEEDNKSKRKKRKKGRDGNEIINSIIAGDNEVQFLDDKQERKTKKRKNCDDSISGMQEIATLKSRNESKGTEDTKFKSNEGIAAKGQTWSNEGNDTFMRNGEEEDNKSKRKKRKKGRDSNEIINSIIAGDNEMQFLDDKQERKIKKRKNCNDSISGMQKIATLKSRNESKGMEDTKFKSNEGGSSLARVKMTHSVVIDNDDQGKKIRKKEKLTNKNKRIEDSEFKSNGGDPALAESKEGEPHLVKINTGDANERAIATKVDDQRKKEKKKKKKMKKKEKSKEDKRVTFSDEVEVFNDGLVRGKRFTPEEDEKIKEAVYSYIESHGLGDNGLDMILHCGSHPEVRSCWKEIGSALPQRPYVSVYHRAHVLFERDDSRKWTSEEYEFIRKFHENHGAKWKMLADAMGKHRFHVKDAWRRIKLRNTNRGRWLQQEYQKLFDFVNTDLRLRALEDHRKLKHGMLRDNICWEAIGEKLATRTSQSCCLKWYEQLTSPMVAEGEWTDTDDYRLLNALFMLDACCMEEVDWDNLLGHRSGDVCRKRWNQMVRHVGEHGNKSFSEQVEILSKRYCPDLLEAREAFDNKPVVP